MKKIAFTVSMAVALGITMGVASYENGPNPTKHVYENGPNPTVIEYVAYENGPNPTMPAKNYVKEDVSIKRSLENGPNPT